MARSVDGGSQFFTRANDFGYSKHPDEMEPIVRAVVDAVEKPVSAKIRIGWDSQSINGVKVAKDLEDWGASAVAVHGRTTVQKYAGKANWEIIKHIKSKLKIPVIGNGDIKNVKAGMDLLNRTGCDLGMIGRRTIGDPNFFTRLNNKYFGRDDLFEDARESFLKFAKYYKKYDKNKSFSELRTHALWFSKRAALGPKARDKICRTKSIKELVILFES
jgi:tRNA-dihydrouridine synthase